jgi:AcrR family transcriptional regulator
MAATMADIAKAAGISTGNLYRYHSGKAALLSAVIPPAVPRAFIELVRGRVEAFEPGGSTQAAAAPTQHARASEALMSFMLAHRFEALFLLTGAGGSRYEPFFGSLVSSLVELAIAHVQAALPHRRISKIQRFTLERIYENLVNSTVRSLADLEGNAAIREAVEAYARYHLAGLGAFFEP